VVVVIDVHVRKRRSSLGEELDQFLHHEGLGVQVVRPARVVTPLAHVVAIAQSAEEEQVVLSTPKRMSFEIEEDVTVIGRGQQFEAVSEDRVLGRNDEFIDRRLFGVFARSDLESGLAHETFQILVVEFGDRAGARRQLDHGAYSFTFERVALGCSDIGDVDE